MEKNSNAYDKQYINKLEQEIREYEENIEYYRKVYSETFLLGYRDEDDENTDKQEIYDKQIDITSLEDLCKGWSIKTIGKKIENKVNRNITIYNTKPNQKIISFIGNKSKGKTFLFNMLTSDTLVKKFSFTNKLSIKTIDGCKTFLDIPGGNSLNFMNEGSDKTKQSGLTSKFLEQFVIQVSNVIIFVVGIMTIQELQLLKLLKSISANKRIIVVHNMTMILQENDYIQFDNLLKEYGFDLTKIVYIKNKDTQTRKEVDIKTNIIDLNSRIDNTFQYYIDKQNNEEGNSIIHVLIPNNHSRFYQTNLKTIDLIKSIINLSQATINFNLEESLKRFIEDNSYKYFGQAILGNEITITKDLIKLNRNELIIKPHIAYFATDLVTHQINPCYCYYYTQNNTFVIEIELSNECIDLNSNVQVLYDKYLFQIYGRKKEKQLDNTKIEKQFSVMQFGEFFFRISVSISNGLLSNSKPTCKYQDGILEITYTLFDPDINKKSNEINNTH